MVHWAQQVIFGNRIVSIIFISMLQPSLVSKGSKKNTVVMFYVCSDPGGSFFHKQSTAML